MSDILRGDSAEVLKTVAAESVDLLVSDPPYGYSFMGKDWDKAVPAVNLWKQCFRVLKPGAFAFVMSAPRQDVLSQMIVRLGAAGFETAFTPIYWTYASGFPKAANVSKLVDKRLGAERERLPNPPPLGAWRKAEERTDVPTDMPSNDPITPQAKALDGSYAGFQPKPAVEVIIVAMKPLSEKTYVDQALANGKGITWLDDCRIPYQNEDDKPERSNGGYGDLQRQSKEQGFRPYKEGLPGEDYQGKESNPRGRFPANLLVSDDVLNDGKQYEGKVGFKATASSIYGTGLTKKTHDSGKAEYGSYSRYFDLDKWADTVPALKTYPFLICPKASASEKNKGLEDAQGAQVNDGREVPPDNAFQRGQTVRQNTHPTVKPVKLMAYLVTLGSRPGDLVLDPFNGSGTTGIAAKLLNRRYLGVELSEEYATIAEKRIAAWKPEDAKKVFPELLIEVDGVKYNALDAFELHT